MKFILAAALLLFTLPAVSEAQSEPPHGMGELEAYSVFVDAYRSGDFELAINFGEWMMEAKPREIEGFEGFSLERTMNRMIDIYTGAAEEESDPTQSTAFLEKAESIFGLVFDTFGEDEIDEFEWHLRMGRFYHENHESMGATIDDAMASYEKLYELDRQRFTDEGDGFFARILLMHYANQEDREQALAMIDKVEGFAGPDLQGTIDEVREALFENPEERIDFLESRLADADGNEKEEMLENLVELYEETGQAELAADRALQLYKLNASFVNTRKIADIHLSDGNYREAIGFLKEAEQLAEADSDRQQIKLEIAEAYQQEQELREAREYARQAAAIDDDAGAAYLRKASIYAATISQCTGGNALERHDRTVYWLVLDYLEKAAQADPSLASNVENRAESYKEAMPSSEDKFFSGWEEGDTFEINSGLHECYAWINETTTVR